MDLIDAQSAEALPKVKAYCNKLVECIEQNTVDLNSFNINDHFKFALTIFLARQKTHIEAVFQLANHRDSMLIARSMLEGLIQIIWMAQDPEVRALKWRQFSYVHDWRIILSRKKENLKIDEQVLLSTKNNLLDCGEQFLPKKKRQGREYISQFLKKWEDPFYRSWTGKKLQDLAMDRDVRGDVLYEANYRFFSSYHHWDTGGFQKTIDYQDGNFSLLPVSNQELVTAYATCFQSLFQTFGLSVIEFNLGIEKFLMNLKADYLETFSKIRPEDEMFEGH